MLTTCYPTTWRRQHWPQRVIANDVIVALCIRLDDCKNGVQSRLQREFCSRREVIRWRAVGVRDRWCKRRHKKCPVKVYTTDQRVKEKFGETVTTDKIVSFIRPPGILTQFFLTSCSFFAHYSPSSLYETQSKRATYSKVSAIWKRMSEIWGIPFPANRGPQTIFFRRL